MLYIKEYKRNKMINSLTKGGIKSICRSTYNYVISMGDFAWASKYANT